MDASAQNAFRGDDRVGTTQGPVFALKTTAHRLPNQTSFHANNWGIAPRRLDPSHRIPARGATHPALASAPSLLACAAVRRYDLKTTEDLILWQKTAEDVEELFREGKIDLETGCRMTGLREWHELNEFFPTLKYQTSGVLTAHRGPDPARGLDLDDRGSPARTSALVAGWICFGLGVAIAWLFPLAHFFYSVAIILAIICMATHQVKRGLVLLLMSCAGIGVSAAIFFALAVGTVANIIAPQLAEAEKERQRSAGVVNQQIQSVNRAVAQIGQAPAFRNSPVAQAPVEPERPLEHWTASELLAESSRLESIQRSSRKAGHELPAWTVERLQKVQAAFDEVTARGGR